MMPRLRHARPLPPSHAFWNSSAPFSTFFSTPMPSESASARLLQLARLPPLHDCANSAAARRGSAGTPTPSLYMTPRLRHASKSPATHFLSNAAATSFGSTDGGAPPSGRAAIADPLPVTPAASRAGFLSRHAAK